MHQVSDRHSINTSSAWFNRLDLSLILSVWRTFSNYGAKIFVKTRMSVWCFALDWASSWDFLLLSRVLVPLDSSTPLAVMALAFSSSSQRCRYCCRARFSAATASFYITYTNTHDIQEELRRNFWTECSKSCAIPHKPFSSAPCSTGL